MLDNETKEQLQQYLALLESEIVFSASLDESDDSKSARVSDRSGRNGCKDYY